MVFRFIVSILCRDISSKFRCNNRSDLVASCHCSPFQQMNENEEASRSHKETCRAAVFFLPLFCFMFLQTSTKLVVIEKTNGKNLYSLVVQGKFIYKAQFIHKAERKGKKQVS